MDDFKQGDVVWHYKKGYMAIIERIMPKDNVIDVKVRVIDGGKGISNITKIKKDKLGQLLYG